MLILGIITFIIYVLLFSRLFHLKSRNKWDKMVLEDKINNPVKAKRGATNVSIFR